MVVVRQRNECIRLSLWFLCVDMVRRHQLENNGNLGQVD